MNRQSAHWMKREDERILEFLDSEDMATAELISREVFRKVSPDHVAERLAKLEYAGLVHRVGMSSFELTGEGQRYLAGDLDAEHQPRPRRV
ncbi:hypothetical protein ACFQH2_13975 [Natronoarchaeum sp. GCM10025703]|uniref:hypothetical protein n=1 Tax=unclassified Natronoarchaeum TaxID=2620183 RepID=UPI00360C9EAA